MEFYHKLQTREPRFTVGGRDYTAPATVDFWVYEQRWIRRRVAQGIPPEVAAKELRGLVHRFFEKLEIPPLDADDPLLKKLTGAFAIADDMGAWPLKKLAD